MSSSHGTWTASPKDANSGGTFSASFLTGTTMLSSCTDATPTQRSADAIPSTPAKWKEDASSAPRGIRDAPLHVVRKRFIRNVAEGDAGPESRPNGFGQLAYGHADGRGEIKVLVDGAWALQAETDAPPQISAVGVMAHLVPRSQEVQGVLALQHLGDEVRQDVAHGQGDVPGEHAFIGQGPALADAHAVERPHDRIRQPILFPSAAGEVLARQLLEAIRGARRRRRELGAFRGGKHLGRLEDH